MRRIHALPHTSGMLAEEYPGEAATLQAVALGPGLAALALLCSGQLLEAPVKRFCLPARIHRVDDPLTV